MSAHIPSPRVSAHQVGGQELVTAVYRIVWEGEEGDACIFEGDRGVKVVCEGAAGALEEGVTYRFLGRFFEDPKFGRQFKATCFLDHDSHDRKGVVKYLKTNCTGIGEAIAGRLFDCFNSSAVRMLREEPEKAGAAAGIDDTTARYAAEELQRASKFEATTIDLYSLFAGRGFGATAISACIRRWNVRAAQVARTSPFSLLLAGIPRAGFRTVDRLYSELGGLPTALKRQALAGWNALREASSGNTWHPKALFAKGVVEQVGISGARVDDALALASRRAWGIPSLLTTRGEWIADPRHAANEKELAAGIARLFDTQVCGWKMPPEGTISEHQAAQLAPVMDSPLIILTGEPGTGKTFLAAQLFKTWAQSHGQNRLAVCAPTGKASLRITESMRKADFAMEATTIHRLLRVGRNGHDGGGWGFEFNADNPLPYEAIGVDELSMCDTDLFAALLMALAPGTILLLIGDPYQLPPVGHGAPLRDMIAANLPRAHLTEIKRNSGMVTVALARIREGKSFKTTERLDVDAGKNFKIIECDGEVAQLEALRAVVEAVSKKEGIVIAEHLQVLAFLNEKSGVSCKPLNAYLNPILNPIRLNDPRPKNDLFRLRDKVICRSNTTTDLQEFNPMMQITDTSAWSPKYGAGNPAGRTFVANGDIGAVIAVSARKAEIIVKFKQPDRFVRWKLAGKKTVDDASLGGNKEDLAHANVITVHKSQGSEWPYVVVMADPLASTVASREGWYTATSRMAKWCIIIGRRAVVERQIRRAELPLRKTFLKELLWEIDEDGPVVADDFGSANDLVQVGKDGEDGQEE